jgi:hypothetical protein
MIAKENKERDKKDGQITANHFASEKLKAAACDPL